MTNTFCSFYDFAKACRAGSDAIEYYERTKQVYEFLSAHKGEKFSPSAIADGLNKQKLANNEKGFWVMTKDTVKNPLRFLKKLNLVGNTSYKKTIHIVPLW